MNLTKWSNAAILSTAPKIAAPREMSFAAGIARGEAQKTSDISRFVIGV
jgi:hypothetical protein